MIAYPTVTASSNNPAFGKLLQKRCDEVGQKRTKRHMIGSYPILKSRYPCMRAQMSGSVTSLRSPLRPQSCFLFEDNSVLYMFFTVLQEGP